MPNLKHIFRFLEINLHLSRQAFFMKSIAVLQKTCPKGLFHRRRFQFIPIVTLVLYDLLEESVESLRKQNFEYLAFVRIYRSEGRHPKVHSMMEAYSTMPMNELPCCAEKICLSTAHMLNHIRLLALFQVLQFGTVQSQRTVLGSFYETGRNCKETVKKLHTDDEINILNHDAALLTVLIKENRLAKTNTPEVELELFGVIVAINDQACSRM